MITKRIKVYGIVQGVGFRPTVARHAAYLGIKGSVSNLGPYVEIYAQGEENDVDSFIDLIRTKPPKRAAVLKMDVKVKDAPVYDAFNIIESVKTSGEIFVSPDIADGDIRRYEYLLISPSAMNASKNFLTRRTEDISIRL